VSRKVTRPDDRSILGVCVLVRSLDVGVGYLQPAGLWLELSEAR
jgi:hypothetical protein